MTSTSLSLSGSPPSPDTTSTRTPREVESVLYVSTCATSGVEYMISRFYSITIWRGCQIVDEEADRGEQLPPPPRGRVRRGPADEVLAEHAVEFEAPGRVGQS